MKVDIIIKGAHVVHVDYKPGGEGSYTVDIGETWKGKRTVTIPALCCTVVHEPIAQDAMVFAWSGDLEPRNPCVGRYQEWDERRNAHIIYIVEGWSEAEHVRLVTVDDLTRVTE